MRSQHLKRTLIFDEIVLDIVTISLAFSINFFKSWKATLILWSVALCCSSILLSIPTIPKRIFELTGAAEGFGVKLGGDRSAEVAAC